MPRVIHDIQESTGSGDQPQAAEFYETSADYLSRLQSSGSRTYAQVARHALWRWKPPQAGPRVLDYGCGAGEFSRLLVGIGYQVVGADISHLFLRDALQRHGGQPGLCFVQTEPGTRLPFGEGYFDAVTAINVIEHVAQPAAVLGELARVLKPGGVMVLTFPNLLSPFRPLKRFLSREPLPRYGPESGDSAGESFRLMWRNLRLLFATTVTRRPQFAPREADFAHANLYYELGYGADYDAVWLCNPQDVALQARKAGVRSVECTAFPVGTETQLGRLGRMRTHLPTALSSPILWVGRKG